MIKNYVKFVPLAPKPLKQYILAGLFEEKVDELIKNGVCGTDGSSNPLEQFIVLAKTVKGAAAANLILQAINAPNVYVFAELLSQPNISDLSKQSQFQGHYELLELFAYGTFSDYAQNVAKFTPLSVTDHMITKLRQLTVVSLATRNKILPYVLLLKELALSNVRELEDLIIDAIYNGVIVGKLDQRQQTLEVEHCMGRDVKSEQLDVIIDTLDTFYERCQTMLSCMEQQISRADKLRADCIANKQRVEQEFINIKKTLKATNAAQGVSVPEFLDGSVLHHDVSSSSAQPPEKKKDKGAARRIGYRLTSKKP